MDAQLRLSGANLCSPFDLVTTYTHKFTATTESSFGAVFFFYPFLFSHPNTNENKIKSVLWQQNAKRFDGPATSFISLSRKAPFYNNQTNLITRRLMCWFCSRNKIADVKHRQHPRWIVCFRRKFNKAIPRTTYVVRPIFPLAIVN